MIYGDIGMAVKALHEGKRVRNEEWPSDKKFIFKQVDSCINSSIVPKMQSLPSTVKDFFQTSFDSPEEQIDAIYYGNQIALVGLSNAVEAYNPSCRDLLSNCWVVLD